jgi:hypothetical protein
MLAERELWPCAFHALEHPPAQPRSALRTQLVSHAPSSRPAGAGEWLCWPCKRHEEEQLAKGVAAAQIRPPRWQAGQAPGEAPALRGGSRDTTCALCPIKGGAFRQTVDGRHWVHQVRPWGWHAARAAREL